MKMTNTELDIEFHKRLKRAQDALHDLMMLALHADRFKPTGRAAAQMGDTLEAFEQTLWPIQPGDEI